MHVGSMVWGGWPQAPVPKEEHRIRTHISFTLSTFWASQVALVIKNPPATAGDTRDPGSVPRWGRSPGEGHGNLLQCSRLENPVDRRAW